MWVDEKEPAASRDLQAQTDINFRSERLIECQVQRAQASLYTAKHPLLSQTMLSGRFAARAARAAAPRAPIAPVRTYAAAASSASTKPPVALFGVDGTYASALVCSPHP